MQFGAPEPLAAAHRLDGCACGEAVLDDRLKPRALSNQSTGASRTFVVTDENGHVCGYYAIAAGAVSHELATSGVRRSMPVPVPVLVLARLAVDRSAQGLHLGAALLQDAVNRAVAVSRNVGVRALLVHALHEKARQFYVRHGFQPSPTHPMTRMLRLSSVKAQPLHEATAESVAPCVSSGCAPRRCGRDPGANEQGATADGSGGADGDGAAATSRLRGFIRGGPRSGRPSRAPNPESRSIHASTR